MKQFVLILLFAPILAADLLRWEESLDAMGTTYVVVAYGADRAKVSAAVEAAFDEVRRLDRLLSNYRPESEISQLNRAAGDRPFPVSDEVFRLLSACLQYSRESDGAFDVTVGPLMRVWGFYKGSGRLPHRSEVRGALTRVGYHKIRLNPAARTVSFTRKGIEIDPGGIGKGYAVDRMVEILKNSGVTSAFISAGTSTLYAIGAPPGEAGWPVQLRRPKDESRIELQMRIRDESMSTSGNYEKFFWANGRIHSHIMDPRTGFPAQGVVSASVISPKALDSEAWTKPLFIDGRKWTATLKAKGFRGFLCEDRGFRSEPACAQLQ